MATKTRELTPITEARSASSGCPICHPRKDRLREDQVWGRCPTNALHRHPSNSKETTG